LGLTPVHDGSRATVGRLSAHVRTLAAGGERWCAVLESVRRSHSPGAAPGPPPIRGKGTRFRWSGTCTATLSGAVSAGSNPAGGAVQRNKFEYSDNLGIVECQACDLRKRRPVSDLAPRSVPGTSTSAAESPAQRPTATTVTRPLPCPEAVALPPIPAANKAVEAASAMPGGGCPSRPIATEDTWTNVSRSVTGAPHLHRA
jgi:hypothetical protein